VLDTHAGAGKYMLRDELTGDREPEWRGGIGKLWDGAASAPEIAAYMEAVRSVQPDPQQLSVYPGSPLLAAHMLRPQDRLVAVESVSTVARELQDSLPRKVRATVQCTDGYSALRAVLPPVERRGLILIDPPYEATADQIQTLEALTEGLDRFATGVFAVWLPIKHSAEVDAWVNQFTTRVRQPKLVSQLWLYPRDTRVGLAGSCLAIVNPPYRLAERMRDWVPALVKMFSSSPAAGCDLRVIDAT
jgi:23S rRNA (adenine2030-N6)-methyltransferase